MKVITEVFVDGWPRVVRVLDDCEDEVEWINWWLAQERNNYPGMRKPLLFHVTELIDGSPSQGMGVMAYLVIRDSISDPGRVEK